MPNEAERERWNSETQVKNWPKRERLTTSITPFLLAKLAPQLGERLLEIGCGGGLAAIEAARAVAPSGHVTGFDLSAGLVGLASQRAADASVANVRFHHGDAQTDDIPGAPFDAAMSQFGVMFFADPPAAFANIRRHLRPGARLAFACWQPAPKNPWYPIPVMAKYAPAPPPKPAPGGPPSGPFAFGDETYVHDILSRAGFTDITADPLEHDMTVPADTMYERDIFASLRLAPEREDEAWRELLDYIAPFRTDDGRLRLRLAARLTTARNPG